MDLSVVVIGKNEETRIVDCLNSILEGIPHNITFEIVYVDNGSNDRTVEIVRNYPARVIQTQTGKMKSPYSIARNIGVSESKGELLQFIDADCILEREWLNTGIGYLERNPRAGIVAGRVTEAHPSDGLLGRVYRNHCDGISIPGKRMSLDGPAQLARMECFRKAGPPNPSIGIGGGCELDISTRIRLAGYEIFRLPEPMVLHRGPRSGALSRLAVTPRSGYRYARTTRRLMTTYPNDRELKRIARKNTAPAIVVLLAAFAAVVAGTLGCAIIAAAIVSSIIGASVVKRRLPDALSYVILASVLRSFGFVFGLITWTQASKHSCESRSSL